MNKKNVFSISFYVIQIDTYFCFILLFVEASERKFNLRNYFFLYKIEKKREIEKKETNKWTTT